MRPAVLLLLLFPLVIGTGAFFAWQRAGQNPYTPLEAEGEILTGVVAGAALEASEALALAESNLEARLAAVARRADVEVAGTRAPAADILNAIARDERIGRIFLLDESDHVVAEGRWPPELQKGDGGPLGKGRRRAMHHRHTRMVVKRHAPKPGVAVSDGLRSNRWGTRDSFGVVYGRRDGGSLLVRANADELAELEQRFGLQHMVSRMVELDVVQAIRLIAPDGEVRVLKEREDETVSGEPLRKQRDVEVRGGVHRVEIDLSRAGADASVTRARTAILIAALVALAISLSAALLLLRLEGARRREAAAAAARLHEERRLAEMGALAGLVTHEVNNPLNAIRLGVRVLKDAGGTQGPVLQTIDTEVERMAKTLEGYMGLARSEGRPAEPVGPDLVERVLRRTAAQAAQAGVGQVAEIAGDARPALGDSVVLDQALSNLVRNALQASPQGATVTVSWTNAEDEPDMVAIAVRDAGPGFPEDRDALLRLGGTRRASGHGLGLPLAKRFIESHGGRLQLLDVDGGGARVLVHLPAAPKAAQEGQAHA